MQGELGKGGGSMFNVFILIAIFNIFSKTEYFFFSLIFILDIHISGKYYSCNIPAFLLSAVIAMPPPHPPRAAVVHLNLQAGSTFPVPVCTVSPGLWINKADTQ